MGIYRVPVTITNLAVVSGLGANVWHVQPATDALVDVQAAIDGIRDFYTALAGRYNTSTTLVVGSRVLRIDVTPQPIIASTPRVVAGTDGGGAIPAQLANVVSWRTAIAGRSYRGRTYLGPFAASQLSGTVWISGLSTGIGTAAAALIAAGRIVVWSEKLQVATPIIGYATDTHVETMRSRN